MLDLIQNIATNGLGYGDLGLSLMRGATGLFFAISGYHKLFNAQRHASLVSTLAADHIPFLRVNQWFVPSVEFSAGIALTIGLFTPIAALMLMGICLVATCTDGLRRITGYLDVADYVDDVLYLPEVLLFFMLAVFFMGGADALSIDRLIF